MHHVAHENGGEVQFISILCLLVITCSDLKSNQGWAYTAVFIESIFFSRVAISIWNGVGWGVAEAGMKARM